MKDFNFNNTKLIRKKILNENKNVDSCFIQGNNNILISVPHGVSQTRLGKYKVAEIGTIPTGIILGKNTLSHVLIKTQNNFDDANFDVDCNYRKRLKEIIKTYNIKYVIDIHGLAKWRDYDINFGTNLCNNIENDVKLYNKLLEMLSSKFKVKTDYPFMGSGNTISSCVKKDFDIWTLQVEINCNITNYSENIEKYKTLLEILTAWLKSFDKNKE